MKSLKFKAMLFALCFILIAISVLSITSYLHFQRTLEDEIHESLVQSAKDSGAYLSYFTKHYMEPLKKLVTQLEIKSMDWSRQKPVLESQVNPYYLEIAIVDTTGIAKYSDGTELDLSDRPYIQRALSGKSTFSEVLISRYTNQPVIMIALPIVNNNHVEGALIARLKIDFLSDFAALRSYNKQGNAYIISDAGSFISPPQGEIFQDFLNLDDLFKNHSDFIDFKDFIERNDHLKSGYDRFNYQGQGYLTGFSKVKDTSWTIYISLNQEEALEPLNRLTNILIIGLISTSLVSAIAAWIFIRGLTKPIESLDQLMDQGAGGNLNIRFESKSKDEIGRLGDSFNRMMDKIKTLTQYDALTGLLNQHVLESEIDKKIQDKNPKPFGLIMVAITQFSLINETYGYVTGDLLLVEISKRIKKCIGLGCEVYRYKGDEFVILCSDSEKDRIHAFSKKSLMALTQSYEINHKVIDLNINIGVYEWDMSLSHEDPLKSVAHAKNYAKELGGNQIQVFDPEMHSRILDERELESDLIKGLKEDQFYLVYQPLFSVNDHNLVEMEALIRWKHPEKGMVFPDQFIPLAEKSKTIVAMDLWVIDKVCREITKFDSSLKEVIMSINITSKTFEAPYFIDQIREIIHRYKVDPSKLQFEITERMVIESIDESIEKLNTLRAMGISIALDDFGIGYSSLSYIVRLPLDRIKIDRSFVQNMHESHEAKLIVSGIISLCKSLNLIVIAEGVELQEEFDDLKKLECDIVQGYFFSKPIELDLIKEKYFKI